MKPSEGPRTDEKALDVSGEGSGAEVAQMGTEGLLDEAGWEMSRVAADALEQAGYRVVWYPPVFTP